jgi:hypothetical protein
MFDSLFGDIRYSLRGLLKRKAFTVIAVTILALGIGANTAIFTLINAVVLKPLPVSNPDELVLFNTSPSEGTRTSDGDLAQAVGSTFLMRPTFIFANTTNRFRN